MYNQIQSLRVSFVDKTLYYSNIYVKQLAYEEYDMKRDFDEKKCNHPAYDPGNPSGYRNSQ